VTVIARRPAGGIVYRGGATPTTKATATAPLRVPHAKVMISGALQKNTTKTHDGYSVSRVLGGSLLRWSGGRPDGPLADMRVLPQIALAGIDVVKSVHDIRPDGTSEKPVSGPTVVATGDVYYATSGDAAGSPPNMVKARLGAKGQLIETARTALATCATTSPLLTLSGNIIYGAKGSIHLVTAAPDGTLSDASRAAINGSVYSLALLADDRILACTGTELYLLEVAGGELLHVIDPIKLEVGPTAGEVSLRGDLVVVNTATTVQTFRYSGNQLSKCDSKMVSEWRSWKAPSFVAADGTIVCTSEHGALHVLQADAQGKLTQLEGKTFEKTTRGGAIIAKGYVLVGCADGWLRSFAIDRELGALREVGAVDLGSVADYAPVVTSNGIALAMSLDGKLHALQLGDDGSLSKTNELLVDVTGGTDPSFLRGPPIALLPNGSVLAATRKIKVVGRAS
jgi:hypothetical protein